MPPTKTYGLTHIAITVKDLERTRKFYADVFDMTVMYHTDDFLQLTTPGCYDILVFEKNDQATAGNGGGIMHFGFRLREAKDIEDVVKRLDRLGAKVKDRGEFLPGSPYVFFEDPDGYEVEVWYELLPTA